MNRFFGDRVRSVRYPADNLFVREDLSKPENRINVAIFGMMTVEPFACVAPGAAWLAGWKCALSAVEHRKRRRCWPA